MGAEDYIIKLYGHGSSDPKEFCDDLARILDVSIYEAEELLSRVPVVVKRGMNKADADELYVLLQSISAWSIMEAPDGLSIAEQRPDKPIYRAIAEDVQDEFRSEGNKGHPLLWLGVLLGLILFLGLFTLVGVLSSVGSVSHSISAKKPVTIQPDQSDVPEVDTVELESPDIIRERIQQLESSLRSLYAQRTEVQESWNLEDAVSLERELRNQIRAEYRELRILKGKLELMESEEPL
jgi:hypothetical protein